MVLRPSKTQQCCEAARSSQVRVEATFTEVPRLVVPTHPPASAPCRTTKMGDLRVLSQDTKRWIRGLRNDGNDESQGRAAELARCIHTDNVQLGGIATDSGLRTRYSSKQTNKPINQSNALYLLREVSFLFLKYSRF